MKNLSLTTLLILITLGFSSCSQDDNTLLEEPSAENLLKSYRIQRDASGAYSLDYQLNQGAASDNIKDEKTNTSNIYLYSSESQRTNSNLTEGLEIQKGQLTVGFNDTEKEKQSFITIVDNDIVFSKNETNENLESYSISGNEDGTYDLDFNVKDGIIVEYAYNEDSQTYEIHLSHGDSSETTFSTSFDREDGEVLKIDFVNYSGSRVASRTAAEVIPKIIIDTIVE